MRIEDFRSALLSALVIVSIIALAILLLSPSPVHAALTPHDPIYINGNAGFTPENGVNGGGSGMESDPYIIENWEISAAAAHGIYIEGTTAYFVVRNCVVENGGTTYHGIYLNNVVNGRVENCISQNNLLGINLEHSDNNTLSNNTCSSNSWSGIYLYYSDSNILDNNTCENNNFGIVISRSDNNTLGNNTLSNNQHNFGVVGSSISHFVHDIDTSNLVNGKPICYLVDNHDEVVGPSLNMGYLGLVNCDNIRVENLSLGHNEQGILLAFTQNCLVENCILENNSRGIYLPRSDNNILFNNICENNDYYGIEIGYSDNNTVESNTCKNSQHGILLYNSYNNPLINNICENNDYGIMLYSSYNNTLTNNIFENNDLGIWLCKSDNNRIYHNNFINNYNQASDDSSNYWDNGYPSGGNYWSDYTGEDNYRGENQDIPGSDGIGEAPYYIPGGNNKDRYPLMMPWSEHFGLADTPWPKFMHDERNTGRSQYLGAQDNTLKWAYQTDGAILSSPIIDSDGNIYIVSTLEDWLVRKSILYSISPDNSLRWSREFYSGFIEMYASPAIGLDGTIYVVMDNLYLYALNPDGGLKWVCPIGSTQSPAIGPDGTIYIGSSIRGPNFAGFAAIHPNGTLKWDYPNVTVPSSPAIGPDGTVYIGIRYSLYAFNQNGAVKWSYRLGESWAFTPTIGPDGTIYVATFGAPWYKKDNEEFVWASLPGLYAFNPNGTVKWFYSTGYIENNEFCGQIYRLSPAIGLDGTIYIGSDDSRLYAINPDNTLKWFYQTGGHIRYSSPAIGADGTIYFGSSDGKLYALNPDATLKWSYQTGGGIFSSPSIAADGTIYFGSKDGKLYAVRGPTAIPATIDIDPDTLNLKSRGRWITCSIELPEGHDVADIDIGSIRLNGVVPAEPKPTGIGGRKLIVKFSRPEVQAIVDIGEVELTVTGLVNGMPFEGNDTIRVIKPGKADLELRFTDIPMEWVLAQPAERVELEMEFSEIPLLWALAPS